MLSDEGKPLRLGSRAFDILLAQIDRARDGLEREADRAGVV
jgi:hypothetical protein